jgi:hypothetical protein
VSTYASPVFWQSLCAKKISILCFKTKDDVNTPICHNYNCSKGDDKHASAIYFSKNDDKILIICFFILRAMIIMHRP